MNRTTQPSARRVRSDPNVYPKGWSRQRVQKVIDHYDKQSDDGAVAEAESAYGDKSSTMMQIPNELVPKVQKLISKRAG